MMRRVKFLLLGGLVALLAGCASSGRLVTAAEGVRVFDLQFDTGLDWARSRQPRVELWTIDGLPLNEFVVISKVRPNEHVFLAARERKSRPDGPWYRAGMRPDEIRDLLLDALRGDGWSHVAASKLRPARPRRPGANTAWRCANTASGRPLRPRCGITWNWRRRPRTWPSSPFT